MEKISAWMFIVLAILAIPQVAALLSGITPWLQVIALAVVGIAEIKGKKR